MKTNSIIIIILFFFAYVACDPWDDFHPEEYTPRKNISIENQSSLTIDILHISSGLYVMRGDSTLFTLKPGDVYNDWKMVHDRNIYEYLKEEWGRDIDTLKVFRNNELLKTYHGPLDSVSDHYHSPYCSPNWKVVKQHDTISARFTFTDRDFE